MLWGRKESKKDDGAGQALRDEVQGLLPDADEETVRIIAACAGLLAVVAYADRDYSETEERRVLELLATVQGIDEAGAQAIASVLSAHALELSTVHASRFTRTLKELSNRDMRVHVLELLVEVAAADDELTQAEVKVLRQLTTSLGLEQDDYNALQAKHREKLSALKAR